MNQNYLHIIGACAIYQLKDGSITITTGDKDDASTSLSKKQIEDLKLDVSKIVGFDHELYLKYYEGLNDEPGIEFVHPEFQADLDNKHLHKKSYNFSILKTSCTPDNYQFTIWGKGKNGGIEMIYHYDDILDIYADVKACKLVFSIELTELVDKSNTSCSPANFKS